MRISVVDRYLFPNGVYIFDKQGTQINPDSPQGQAIQNIYKLQAKAKVESLPQKYRAEVAHNIDINKDGIIGKPSEISMDAELTVSPDSITIKPKTKKKKSKQKAWI